jgi:hypothetical protein
MRAAPTAPFAGWRRALGALALGAGLLAAVPRAGAQESAPSLEAQVEAAFLVNFVRYTDWPPEVARAPGEPYVITVVGADALADSLERLAQVVAPVRGRRIEVRRLAFPQGADAQVRAGISERLRRSHLVFVRDTEEPVEQILGDLSGQPVLTVSDRDGFAAVGGMLGLHREGGRIGFEANPAAIRNARLVVSAKVLKLARLVEGRVR